MWGESSLYCPCLYGLEKRHEFYPCCTLQSYSHLHGRKRDLNVIKGNQNVKSWNCPEIIWKAWRIALNFASSMRHKRRHSCRKSDAGMQFSFSAPHLLYVCIFYMCAYLRWKFCAEVAGAGCSTSNQATELEITLWYTAAALVTTLRLYFKKLLRTFGRTVCRYFRSPFRLHSYLSYCLS